MGRESWIDEGKNFYEEQEIYKGVRISYDKKKHIAIQWDCDATTSYVTSKFWNTSGWTTVEPDIASITSLEQWTRHCDSKKRKRFIH